MKQILDRSLDKHIFNTTFSEIRKTPKKTIYLKWCYQFNKWFENCSMGWYIILENDVVMYAFSIIYHKGKYWLLKLSFKVWKNTYQTVIWGCLRGLRSEGIKWFLFYFVYRGEFLVFYSKKVFLLQSIEQSIHTFNECMNLGKRKEIIKEKVN